MPQELHALKCCACSTFQVHIVKKVPKWTCKICNEKQSVKKIYGIGSGKDCRLLVQKLNLENFSKKPIVDGVERKQSDIKVVPAKSAENKWIEFLPSEETVQEFENDSDINCIPLHSLPSNLKRKFGQIDDFESKSQFGHTELILIKSSDAAEVVRFPYNKLINNRSENKIFKNDDGNNTSDADEIVEINNQNYIKANSSSCMYKKERINVSSTSKVKSELTKSNSKWDDFISSDSEEEIEATNVFLPNDNKLPSQVIEELSLSVTNTNSDIKTLFSDESEINNLDDLLSF